MSRFIQIHALAVYPASNPNRDDTGRPKSVRFGNSERMRISSQSLKRCWRTSESFKESLGSDTGVRTRTKSNEFYQALKEKLSEKVAAEFTKLVFSRFGKIKEGKEEGGKAKKITTEQIAHYSPEEIAAIDRLQARIIETSEEPTKEELDILRKDSRTVDIAMFGRMFADDPAKNTDAAVQVAHAFTVNPVAIEDDYFTAVDDLNKHEEDAGAGHLGETGYGSGVFYLYVCVNADQLAENLKDEGLRKKSLETLLQTILTVCPTGKSNSFAHQNYVQYALVEKGGRSPRSLASAFLKPVTDADLMAAAVEKLNGQRNNLDEVYGPCAEASVFFDVSKGEGSLSKLVEFIADRP